MVIFQDSVFLSSRVKVFMLNFASPLEDRRSNLKAQKWIFALFFSWGFQFYMSESNQRIVDVREMAGYHPASRGSTDVGEAACPAHRPPCEDRYRLSGTSLLLGD